MLITGESGTGKELVARAFTHSGPDATSCFWRSTARPSRTTCWRTSSSAMSGARSPGPTATMPGCSSRPGAGRSSWTRSASWRARPRPSCLRAIENKEVLPVGATHPVSFQARLLTATNKDLAAEVAADRFRADLYYRLNVVSIHLPPLARPTRRYSRAGRRLAGQARQGAWANGSTASTTRRSAD